MFSYEDSGFFTRDDERDYIEEPLKNMIQDQYDVDSNIRCYIEDGNRLDVDIDLNDGYSFNIKLDKPIDMRRIRLPKDLTKYVPELFDKFSSEYSEATMYDEVEASTSITGSVDISDIPEENKHGDCFVVALHKFMENPKRYTLVHGIVTGQGAIEGVQYCHAWVIDEKTDNVIDMTLPAGKQKIPVNLYYYIGDISITKEYNASQVSKMLEKYGTYGPWDAVFNDYP